MAVADSDENNLVELIMSITYTGETITLKIWEGLLEREDRHENIDAGEALQAIVNEFCDINNELPLLRFGNGEDDGEKAKICQAVEEECVNNYKIILDEVIKNIMTKLSGENEVFVNNEAFKEKVDNLVFQHIRETFNIKKRISKENIITNVMLKYNIQAVNKVAKHVIKVTDTVFKPF